jgi:hypothetical protein
VLPPESSSSPTGAVRIPQLAHKPEAGLFELCRRISSLSLQVLLQRLRKKADVDSKMVAAVAVVLNFRTMFALASAGADDLMCRSATETEL